LGITTERLPRALMSLEIEVEPDRVEASMTKAAQKLSEQVRIPGFRPGKAPRHIVERHIGRGALLQEALELLIPDIYNEALESEQIDAIDQPQFDLKSTEPLIVSATVPVRPKVDLRDYRSLRAPRPSVEVDEEQVQEAVTNLRRRFATLEPVDRPVQWNDTVRADVTVSVEGQREPHVEEDAEFALREDGVISLPGFSERLIGLERGGPYEIEFNLPEDFQAAELAGKKASYTVTIREVKQEVLPDLDDDFARSLDEGFETAAQLEERIRENLREELERQATEGYRDEIVDLLVASAEMDYPDVLVEREIDRQVDRESNHASHTPEGLQRWLEAIGSTLEEVRDALRESSDVTVRRALALGELVEAEEIEVTEEQVEEEVQRLVEQMTGPDADEQRREAVRGIIDTPEARSSMRNQLLTRVAVERLEEICSQPEGDGEERTERRRGTRRRRGVRAEAEGEAAEAQQEQQDKPDEPDEQQDEEQED
jgi:trigger factor